MSKRPIALAALGYFGIGFGLACVTTDSIFSGIFITILSVVVIRLSRWGDYV